MKIKKRRLKRWVIILIIVFIILLIGGVIYMLYNKNINATNIDNNVLETKNELIEETEVNNELESTPKNYQEFIKLPDGEYLTDKGFTLKIQNGIAYIDDNLIVNKTFALPSDYIPNDPYEEITTERCNNCINKDVMTAFNLMQSDAAALGLNLYIASGYRSYNYQNTLYNSYSAISGDYEADTYSARPGHSEHQSGLCFDLNSVDASFADTDEGIWVANNAYLYGFIIRYPKGKEDITGYVYESWHLRYVGKELANKLYNSGDWITLEEYYGITSSY